MRMAPIEAVPRAALSQRSPGRARAGLLLPPVLLLPGQTRTVPADHKLDFSDATILYRPGSQKSTRFNATRRPRSSDLSIVKIASLSNTARNTVVSQRWCK